MIKRFAQNAQGVYLLEGVLTYVELAASWHNLVQAFFGSKQELVLDCEKITRVDSSFLAFLLALLREAQHRQVRFRIRCITQDIQSLMKVQGIWPLFKELMD
jgi:ABC-type transporter Mla MlaB component